MEVDCSCSSTSTSTLVRYESLVDVDAVFITSYVPCTFMTGMV